MAHSVALANGQQDRASASAALLFESVFKRGLLERLRVALTGTPELELLSDIGRLGADSDKTLRQVSLSEIRGTAAQGRRRDFDGRFRPLQTHNRDRWLNVASARLRGARLPAVRLIQVEDRYYVQDGHHRISVAAALGDDSITAQVRTWQVDACGAGGCLPEPALI